MPARLQRLRRLRHHAQAPGVGASGREKERQPVEPADQLNGARAATSAASLVLRTTVSPAGASGHDPDRRPQEHPPASVLTDEDGGVRSVGPLRSAFPFLPLPRHGNHGQPRSDELGSHEGVVTLEGAGNSLQSRERPLLELGQGRAQSLPRGLRQGLPQGLRIALDGSVYEPRQGCIGGHQSRPSIPSSSSRATDQEEDASAQAGHGRDGESRLRHPLFGLFDAGGGRRIRPLPPSRPAPAGGVRYSGMFPCLREGRRSRLLRAVSRASMRTGRVRRGSMTSST